MEKSVKDLANRSEGVQYYPECQGFYTFSVFILCRMSAKSILPPKMTYVIVDTEKRAKSELTIDLSKYVHPHAESKG